MIFFSYLPCLPISVFSDIRVFPHWEWSSKCSIQSSLINHNRFDLCITAFGIVYSCVFINNRSLVSEMNQMTIIKSQVLSLFSPGVGSEDWRRGHNKWTAQHLSSHWLLISFEFFHFLDGGPGGGGESGLSCLWELNWLCKNTGLRVQVCTRGRENLPPER